MHKARTVSANSDFSYYLANLQNVTTLWNIKFYALCRTLNLHRHHTAASKRHHLKCLTLCTGNSYSLSTNRNNSIIAYHLLNGRLFSIGSIQDGRRSHRQ